MAIGSWTTSVDWQTPAGRALQKLAGTLPPERAFRIVVDLFRPGFDEENAADLANNTRRLWPLLFGRTIDPRQEIIAPALAKRRVGYDPPTRDYRGEIREELARYGERH